jgi:hypothetical protein
MGMNDIFLNFRYSMSFGHATSPYLPNSMFILRPLNSLFKSKLHEKAYLHFEILHNFAIK